MLIRFEADRDMLDDLVAAGFLQEWDEDDPEKATEAIKRVLAALRERPM